MTPETVAAMIAEYLDDRDDVASAENIEGDIRVTTQGGESFIVTVTRA